MRYPAGKICQSNKRQESVLAKDFGDGRQPKLVRGRSTRDARCVDDWCAEIG